MPFSVFAKDYSLPYAKVSYAIQKDGKVFVSEHIRFSFKGTFHWVKRHIEVPRGIRLENIRAGVVGAPARIMGRRTRDGFYIEAYFTTPVRDKSVELVILYTLTGALQLFEDTAQLFPKAWGANWKKKVKKLEVLFNIPGSASDVKFYVHPRSYLASSRSSGSEVGFVFKDVPSGAFVEVRLLMPRSWFTNAQFATVIHKNALPYIIKVEESYHGRKVWLEVAGFTLILIALLVPLLIYIFFGREPKIHYHGIYEREIPYPDPPAKVNAIVIGKVGVPTKEGFLATVMNLVRLRLLSLRVESEKEIFLTLTDKQVPSDLQPYETFVLERIKEISGGKEVLWQDVMAGFSGLFKVWVDMVSSSIDIKKFFYPKGNTLLKVFGVISVVLSVLAFPVVVYWYRIGSYFPEASKVVYIGLISLFVSGIVSLVLPDRVAGRWTRYGLTYYRKWISFRAFLTDFSRLKEYPPSSIVIWESYLVYATALGVAKKVMEHMKVILPEQFSETELSTSPFYIWYINPLWMEMGLYGSMTESLGNIDVGDLGSFDGFGDIGGGFGGGGGDAG